MSRSANRRPRRDGPPRLSRRRSSCGARAQSHGHSAHIGQEVEISYRWHPLHGRRIRRHYAERRAGGEFVHVEAAPGVVIVVAAWMLDPAACAGMTSGAPRLSISALVDLHHLLIERGFRRNSSGDSTIVQEEHDETPAAADAAIHRPTTAQHSARFRKTPGDQLVGQTDGARSAGQTAVGGGRRGGGGARR
jgi:hypothetical protein